MSLFSHGKKDEGAVQPGVITPVEEVLRLRAQNLTNNQIVQSLQKSGYKMHQIFDAMNQADLKSAGPVEGAVPSELSQPPIEGMQEPQPQPNMQETQAQENISYEDQLEEIAESIIDEKWEDLMKNINKLLEWKESMENKISAIDQRVQDLKSGFDNLQQGVIGKVTEYDKTVKTVGTDLKAMDLVFRKVLPALTENVNELSRLTKKSKARQR